MADALPDAIQLLKASIAAATPPSLAPSDNFDTATHLSFAPLPPLTSEPVSIPLSTLTRFLQGGNPVDLRSLYFAWQQRNTAITGYLSSAQALGVTNLGFIERLELVTHLEGGQDDSIHIAPLPSASASDSPAAGQRLALGGGLTLSGKVRQTDPRLLEIYSYERVISNRNTHLRGIKPTDFSHVRKHAEDFITRLRAGATNGGSGVNGGKTATLPTRPGMPAQQQGQKRQRARDPIILLSPSVSSLLTMNNIKQFLEQGTYVPASSTGQTSSLLHVSRKLPGVSRSSPIRFVVVDSPDKFKPEYWDRVVAVFTTGQEWQFRSYRWSSPVELFRNVKGFYVGYEGEQLPEGVKKWGTGVTCFSVSKNQRFKDREVCEKFWEGVEKGMQLKGIWNRS